MNYVKLGDTIRIAFATHSFATGDATDASSTPTVTVREDGTDMGYAPTVTDIGVGEYEVAIVCSTGNGFEVGKFYSARVAATIGPFTAKSGIGSFGIVSAKNFGLTALPDVNAGGLLGLPLVSASSGAGGIYINADETVRADVRTYLGAAAPALVDSRFDASIGNVQGFGENDATGIYAAFGIAWLATAAGGGTDYIDLEFANYAIDDYWNGHTIFLPSSGGASPGSPQSRIIIDYDGTTKRATVDRAWAAGHVPTAATKFVIMATRETSELKIAKSVWLARPEDYSFSADPTYGSALFPRPVVVAAPDTAFSFAMNFGFSGLGVINGVEIYRDGVWTALSSPTTYTATSDGGCMFTITVVNGLPAGNDAILWVSVDAPTGNGVSFEAHVKIDSRLPATSASLVTTIAEAARDALLNYAHRSGRTVRGAIRRLDSLAAGKATGLIGTVVKFFAPDNTTVEMELAQDVSTGSRGWVDVSDSETP